MVQGIARKSSSFHHQRFRIQGRMLDEGRSTCNLINPASREQERNHKTRVLGPIQSSKNILEFSESNFHLKATVLFAALSTLQWRSASCIFLQKSTKRSFSFSSEIYLKSLHKHQNEKIIFSAVFLLTGEDLRNGQHLGTFFQKAILFPE